MARLAVMRNDLETVTVFKFPEIEQIKGQLVAHGAAVALMSGSGPTVFGLFAERERAESCFALFKHRFERTYLVSPLPGGE
jgi:4-diphosphocytidyl-2-C-methyl-D-erythritol kinase